MAIDVDDRKLEAIAKYGATKTLNSRGLDAKAIKAAVNAFAREQGLRSTEWFIFECSGTTAGQLTAWNLLVHGATLSVVGFTMDKLEVAPVEPDGVRRPRRGQLGLPARADTPPRSTWC